jgi:hypothetical protein
MGLHALTTLYVGKGPTVPSEWEAGSALQLIWHGEEKYFCFF